MKGNKGKSRISVLVLLVFIGLFGISSYKVISQLYVDHQQKQSFDSLIELVNVARNNPDMLAQSAAGTLHTDHARNEGAATPERMSVADDAARGGESMPEPMVTGGHMEETVPGQRKEESADSEGMGLNTSGSESVPSPGPTAIRAAGPDGSQGENLPVPEDEAFVAAATEVVPATATPVPPMLSAYEPLYGKNKDFFGWIEITDTTVNYPVMFTPNSPEYYLHRAFDRSQVYSGVPFLAGDCFVGCGNYLIYGHHMKNGTQFAGITEYTSEEFWKEHPTFRFDTLYEVGVYDVVAAFYSKIYPEDVEGVFRYYQYTDLREEENFAEYMRQVMEVAIYETGVEPQFGDQLVTLSTCEYSQVDGRFVVVGRKR